MLSVNVSAYKGNIPRNHVLVRIPFIIWTYQLTFLQDILKKYRFDLPTGIEHDYSNWEKISAYVSYSLTQTRARVKKLVCVSMLTLFPVAQLQIIFISDQRQHKGKNQHIYPCAGDCSVYTLSHNNSALRPCCAYGKPCFCPQHCLLNLNHLACDSRWMRRRRKILESDRCTPWIYPNNSKIINL